MRDITTTDYSLNLMICAEPVCENLQFTTPSYGLAASLQIVGV
jgi:hypothetical protein